MFFIKQNFWGSFSFRMFPDTNRKMFYVCHFLLKQHFRNFSSLMHLLVRIQISCASSNGSGRGYDQPCTCGHWQKHHFPVGKRQTDLMGHFCFHFCQAQMTHFPCSRNIFTTNAPSSLRRPQSEKTATTPRMPEPGNWMETVRYFAVPTTFTFMSLKTYIVWCVRGEKGDASRSSRCCSTM